MAISDFVEGLSTTAPMPRARAKLLGELDRALALATSAARHEDGGWEDEGESEGVRCCFKWVPGADAVTAAAMANQSFARASSLLYAGAKGTTVIDAPAWAVFCLVHDSELRVKVRFFVFCFLFFCFSSFVVIITHRRCVSSCA